MLANAKISYLGDGHGDVEELPPATLRNGPGEEQLQPVFRKQRLLVLKTQTRSVEYQEVEHKQFNTYDPHVRI